MRERHMEKGDPRVTGGQEERRKGRVLMMPDAEALQKVRSERTLDRRLVIESLEKALGGKLPERLLAFLRIPNMFSRGLYLEDEYHDIISDQPFPYKQEHDPNYCYEQGLRPPSWIDRWYLSLVQDGGKTFLIFVEPRRRIFMKMPFNNPQEADAVLIGLDKHVYGGSKIEQCGICRETCSNFRK